MEMCLIHKEKNQQFHLTQFQKAMHSQMKPFFLNTEYKVHIKKMWEGIKTSRLVYPCKASASLANLTGMTTRIDFFLVIRTEQ